MKQVIVKQGQTIFDVAIEQYGSIEGFAFLIEDNDIDLTANELSNETLAIRSTILHKVVVDYFLNRTIKSNG